MRYNYSLLLLSTILLCVLSTAPARILAAPSVTNQQPASPFQTPLFSQQTSTGRPWASVRDHLIRFIWRIPERHKDRGFKAGISKSLPGPKRTARYGGDVVLRFKTQTAEDASALAEAANVLFLDVWEFTKEWVDVRLAKEVVRFLSVVREASTAYAPLRFHPYSDCYQLRCAMLILL